VEEKQQHGQKINIIFLLAQIFSSDYLVCQIFFQIMSTKFDYKSTVKQVSIFFSIFILNINIFFKFQVFESLFGNLFLRFGLKLSF